MARTMQLPYQLTNQYEVLMKKLLLVLLTLPTFAYSSDFMTTKLNVLEVRKYRTTAGRLELRFIRDNPRIVLRIAAGNKATNDFFEKVMKSDITRLNCDGDFFPMFDQYGSPNVHVNTLKACIDEEGDVIAHSIGLTPLSDAEVAASKKLIQDNLKVGTGILPVNVNDSNKPKEVIDPKAGVFSPKLRSTAASK